VAQIHASHDLEFELCDKTGI